MTEWLERPRLITEWGPDVECVMSIDENGTTDLNGIRKNMATYLFNDDENDDRWFTISGAVMCHDDLAVLREDILDLKNSYWTDGKFDYKNGIKRVVFHSREIRKKQGPFNPNLIDVPSFLTDLSGLIAKTNFLIYSASINKVKHVLQYSNPYHVYKLCLLFIIERYCIYLRNKKTTGILMLESRGEREDAEVLRFLAAFLRKGNKHFSSKDLSCIKGIYFNPKWCVLTGGQASYYSLEMADLVSYPIHKYVRSGVKDRAYEIIERKLHNYPYVNGFGLKKFP